MTQHSQITDCFPFVAYEAWRSAWRAAHDQWPSDAAKTEMREWMDRSDFIELALGWSNWRNVNALFAAFADAGTMGSTDVAAFYEHTNYVPPGPDQPLHPDPKKRVQS